MIKDPQGILVRAPNWIGDQILAYPFFYYLRRAYPKSRIAVACLPWVEPLQYLDLVDDVFVLPKPIRIGIKEKIRTLEAGARMVRENGNWDLGISLPNSFTAAWFLWRAKVKQRRGYNTDGRGFLLNAKLSPDKQSFRHRASAYLELLPARARPRKDVMEFWGVPPENELDEGIPGELAHFRPETSWATAKPLVPPSEPYWVMAPGSMAESRRWGAEAFIALARKVHDETKWKGLIVGGPAEAPLAQQICEDRSLKLSDWTGKGPVSCYWQVFQKSQFTVSNDSGLAHVAALCGSTTQIIWGAGDPKRTKPLGPGRVRVLFNPVECWPCERNTCGQPLERKLQCLKGISSDSAWEEIQIGLNSKT